MKEKNASNYVSKHKWQYVCSLSISFFGHIFNPLVKDGWILIGLSR